MRPRNSESNTLIQWNECEYICKRQKKHSHIYTVFLSYFTASRPNSESCLRLVAISQHSTITIAKTTHFYWIGNKTSNKDGNTCKKSKKTSINQLFLLPISNYKYKREHEISINNTHLFSFASVSFKLHWFKWIAVSCEMRWMKKKDKKLTKNRDEKETKFTHIQIVALPYNKRPKTVFSRRAFVHAMDQSNDRISEL